MTADSSAIRVVVVDDHPLFRIGIISLLETLEGVEVVGSAETADEAVEVVLAASPAVVLMDLDLASGSSGIDATRRINRERPDIGVLVLTMLGDDESLFAAVRAGARGYLLKESGADDVHRVVEGVMRGEAVFGPKVAEHVVRFFAGGTSAPATSAFPHLTTREREVLDLMARGLDNASIARQLFLSEKTVRNRVSDILAKLQAGTRAEAVARARDAGIGED